MTTLRYLLPFAFALGACGSELDQYEAQGPRYEARGWLAGNPNPYPFAGNRFESKAAATAFVDSLYALGADTVFVLNVEQDSARIQDEGGPYADALLVRLPADGPAREHLFTVNAREARLEGFEPELDQGQQYLYFWWD